MIDNNDFLHLAGAAHIARGLGAEDLAKQLDVDLETAIQKYCQNTPWPSDKPVIQPDEWSLFEFSGSEGCADNSSAVRQ